MRALNSLFHDEDLSVLLCKLDANFNPKLGNIVRNAGNHPVDAFKQEDLEFGNWK